MNEELVQKYVELNRQISESRFAQAASLPEELEAAREFSRDMGENWRHLAEHTTAENVALNSNPMLAELETATLKALIAIEHRLAAIEKSL